MAYDLNPLSKTFGYSAPILTDAQKAANVYTAAGGSPTLFNNSVLTTTGLSSAPAPAPTNNPAPSGGGDLRSKMQAGLIPWDDNLLNSGGGGGVDALQNQQRSEINSGYDSYFSNLDSMLNNDLPNQRTAQEGIANSQYDQGVNNLTTQKTLGMQDLATQRTNADTQQKKTLGDLTDNIRNLFQSGNTFLGARGAGDSSAANQYAYALTQMGSKQRGDVTNQYAQIQNDISGRESRLNEIYSGAVKDLESQKNQQIQGIAQWFASAQSQIKQMQAQGQLSRGQDLAQLSQNALNYAMQQLQTAQADAMNRRSALEQWAANHSNDINSLKQNLASVSSTSYGMPQAQPLAGISGQSGQAAPSLFGYGGTVDQKTDIFGNPIRA